MDRRANRIVLAISCIAASQFASAYTWPDHVIDALEESLYEQSGYLKTAIAEEVVPCNKLFFVEPANSGRINSAEWIRSAYHDMATADVEAGTGGIDASISFETERPENVGAAFNSTLRFFSGFQNAYISMSDLLAMGVVLASEACSNGSLHVPYRGGRVDVRAPGPAGVPKPEEDLAAHTTSFKKQGFNATDMIGLVACGHTLGGVHGKDFPDVVPDLHDPVSQISETSRYLRDGSFF